MIEATLRAPRAGSRDGQVLPAAFSALATAGPLVAGPSRARTPGRPIVDPATTSRLALVRDTDERDIDTAVAAAERAFPVFRWSSSARKSELLSRWASAMRANADALARLITLEQGKPLAESHGEVAYAASYLDWYAQEAMRPHGDTRPTHKPDSDVCVRAEPVGLVAAITPWNFPLAMPARKVAAALAAGCPVLLVPSVVTPLSSLAFATLGYEAGLDPALLQVLPGDGERTVPRVLDHAAVRAVTFTGSTRVGRLVNALAARHLQRVSLELGGHAPFIVFPDVDVDHAVEACIAAKFTTGGQDCLAANRIYLHEDIAARFRERFVARAGALIAGHGLDPGVDIGPMTLRSGVTHCLAQIHDAVAKGARILAGGHVLDDLGAHFIAPTVIDGANPTMCIDREETFGPVAALQTFRSPEDVFRRANRSDYGLAAYVFCNDARTQAMATSVLDYGMIALNTASFTGAPVPFGGFKASGLGKEGGVRGLDEFLRFKYSCQAHHRLDDQRIAVAMACNEENAGGDE